MPLLETDYCVEQINVPPKLPMILKQFCKSAIRTQPYDLLKWSSAVSTSIAPVKRHSSDFSANAILKALTLLLLK